MRSWLGSSRLPFCSSTALGSTSSPQARPHAAHARAGRDTT